MQFTEPPPPPKIVTTKAPKPAAIVHFSYSPPITTEVPKFPQPVTLHYSPPITTSIPRYSPKPATVYYSPPVTTTKIPKYSPTPAPVVYYSPPVVTTPKPPPKIYTTVDTLFFISALKTIFWLKLEFYNLLFTYNFEVERRQVLRKQVFFVWFEEFFKIVCQRSTE